MLWKKQNSGNTAPESSSAPDVYDDSQKTSGIKEKLKRNWKKIVAVVCVAAIAVAIIVPKGKKDTSAQTSQYTEVTPQSRNITNTYSGTGTISAANTYTVKSLVKGTVLTADFEIGDTIEKGTVLYTIDSSDVNSNVTKAELQLSQAQRSYEEAESAGYVRSSISGTVISMKVKAGDVVNAGQEIATVRDDSTLLLSLQFPATDAANFTVGQAAQVTMDGTFEALSGTVQSVSGSDTLSDGNMLVRTVTIAVNNSGSLTATQAATATVNGVSALGSAKLSYNHEQTVNASTSGTVSSVCVKEGSTVSTDTVLIKLTSKDLTKQLQSAADSVTSAELAVSDAQRTLSNYTITSPISGTIISKDIKAGDTVNSSSNSETMCVINDLSYLEMKVNVDELQILSIKEGQSVTITADAISDQKFTGIVTSVSSAGTTSGGTTTYPVTIRIDDTGDLMPGMNATAEITVASAENALSIPSTAVVRGNYVLVTKDSPSAANADTSMQAPDGYVYVKVETGVSDNDYIEIKSGLSAEDTVAYDSSRNTSSSSDEMDFDMPEGDFGGGGGGAPGGGGDGGPGGGF